MEERERERESYREVRRYDCLRCKHLWLLCCLNTSNFVLVQSIENQVEIDTIAKIVQIDILDLCIRVDGAVWSGLCVMGITRPRDVDWCGNGSCATCSDSTALAGFRSDGVVCCCGQEFDLHGRLVLQVRLCDSCPVPAREHDL